LPYNFQIFYRKGILNPVDSLLWWPDYLANAEEVDQIPVSQLLPALSVRIAYREQSLNSPIMGKNLRSKQDEEQSLKPQMGNPIMGENLGLRPKVGISPYVTRSPTIGKSFSNYLLALIAEVVANGLPTIMSEEASVEDSG
jgi:hypothetical protein